MPVTSPTLEQLREDWLKKRRQYITATDVAPICGVHPFGRSAFHVWLEKKDLAPPIDETWQMRRGNYMEEFIAREYAREFNAVLIHRPFILVPHHDSHQYPHFACTPDRLLSKQKIGLEIKTVGGHLRHRWGESGTDDVPMEVFLQCAFSIFCLDYDEWHVATDIGGSDLRFYRIPRDLELEQGLAERLENFWISNVEADIQPELDGSKETQAFLAAKFPGYTEKIKQADPGIEMLLTELAALKETKKDAGEREAVLQNIIIDKIGDALGIQSAEWRFTWRKTKDSKVIDWEAIAKKLGADKDIIKAFTNSKPGYRRPYLSRVK